MFHNKTLVITKFVFRAQWYRK